MILVISPCKVIMAGMFALVIFVPILYDSAIIRDFLIPFFQKIKNITTYKVDMSKFETTETYSYNQTKIPQFLTDKERSQFYSAKDKTLNEKIMTKNLVRKEGSIKDPYRFIEHDIEVKKASYLDSSFYPLQYKGYSVLPPSEGNRYFQVFEYCKLLGEDRWVCSILREGDVLDFLRNAAWPEEEYHNLD